MMKKYDSYKDSGLEWIGEVPEHWELTKIKYLVVGEDTLLIDGDWIESKDIVFDTDNIKYITTGNIGAGFYKEQGNGFITVDTFEKLNCTEVFEGDLLISRLNAPIGRACIIPNLKKRVVTSVDNVILRPNKNYEKRFLVHLMSNDRYFEHTSLIARGATMQRISRSLLADIKICVPPLNEQVSIANFLDNNTSQLDSLIQKKKQMIALLEEEKTAVINEAVTKGQNADAPMKDSGIEWLGMVPAHWEVKRLKHIATVRSGFALNSSVSSGDDSVRLPYLRVANVQDGYLKLDNITEVEIDKKTAQRYILKAGDLLMNEGGDNDKLGRGCVWRGEIEPCLHQNHVFAVRMNDGINPEWVNVLTMAAYARQYFMLYCKQSTNLASISQTNIKELPVLMPPATEILEVLEHISTHTTRINQTISHLKKEIQLMQEYRTALISEAVTGKIDVRDYQPEPITSTALA